MAADTKYANLPWAFDSKGIMARPANDRPPDQHYYLDMAGTFEREESALSSRYGSTVINRDPDGTLGGQNYPLPAKPVTLSRVKFLNGTVARFAGLTDGTLWMRTSDTQGPYHKILNGLSGHRFSCLVSTCFGSSQPFLFVYDRNATVKTIGYDAWTPAAPESIGSVIIDSNGNLQQLSKIELSAFSTVTILAGTLLLTRPVPWSFTQLALGYPGRSILLDNFVGAAFLNGLTVNILTINNPLGGPYTLTANISHPNYGTTGDSGDASVISGSGVGFTGGSVPLWSAIIGAQTQDAGLTWTCIGPATAALSRVGILPPTQPATATQYAPKIQPIDTFQSSAGYGPSGMTLVGISTLATVAGTAGTPVLNYEQYTDATNSFKNAPDGMVATSTNNPDGQLRLKFNTQPLLQTYDIIAQNSIYSVTDTFNFKAVTFSIASNATGHIGKTVALDLSGYQTDDLIVLVIQVDGTAAIQEIRVQFDIDGSNYSSSYYYKSIIPVSYQGSLSLPQVNSPTDAVSDTVSDRTIGINNLWNSGGWGRLFSDVLFRSQVQDSRDDLNGINPAQIASGDGPWSVIYLRKGDFQPVGNAGTPGLDWSNVTGWRVQVTTNTQGSATIAFNGLYIQGSPTPSGIGTLAGPSSFSGISYDFVYTYYNANTRTESNPCPLPKFSVTAENPGGISTLIVLRQAIDILLQYSPDPQVTHVRIYARGGLFGTNFFYADQIPNITGTTTSHYQYILPDASLAQGNPVSLIHDVPVTSTLQQPIDTTLSRAIGPPANTNIPTLQTINVSDTSADFVPTQKVVIGTPQNLEEVYVVTGGSGSFTAFVQLPHDAGERLQVFSVPAQPCFLAAQAYGQTWMAGDTNNPHYLYYSPNSLPEYCPPQNYIPVGTPTDPITAVINFRGALFVRTMSTWYQIFPGNPPYAQSTGSKHGSPASFDWTITESEIWYQGWDGIRTFRGADGPYRSLIIEWLFRNNPLTPIPLVDLNQLSDVISAFKNNTCTIVYPGQDGHSHEISFSTSYNRWRNDNQDISAILLELDTNTLVYSTPIGGGQWVICYEDITKDYDDGGWSGGGLVQIPISMSVQTPYLDQNLPNNQKQYNALTIDANPNGQIITVTLLFDDDNGTIPPITVGTFTGSKRDKFNFQINSGQGQEAYRISLKLTCPVKQAPIIYQADIDAAPLADQRSSMDSYWIKFGFDESKLVKQGYFDYTTADGNSITVKLYADGNTIPYYTFTLPANTNRAEVPMRVRFPAMKLRQMRIILTSTGAFQIWQPVQVDQKPILPSGAKGYAPTEVMGVTV